MNKNPIEGAVEQSERARKREALVIKGRRCRSGGRAVKEWFLPEGISILGQAELAAPFNQRIPADDSFAASFSAC
jgi:hypothetical protein